MASTFGTRYGGGRRSGAGAARGLPTLFLAALFSGSCASTPPSASSPSPASSSASSSSSSPPPESGAARSVSPDALAGNWLLELKVGSRTLEGGLHFANTNGVLVGTWTSAEGDEYELKKISISGDEISWDVDGPSGSRHASGKIDGLSMKGTMKRAARKRGDRDASADPPDRDPAGDSTEPPPDAASGGRTGGGRGGRRGGGRRGGSSGGEGITWSAYKTMEAPAAPAPETESAPRPAPAPTPSGVPPQ